MSPHRERVVRGTIVSEHLVQFFDEAHSLVDVVATHLFDGWQRGDTLMVLARADHWTLSAVELAARGCPIDELTADGRLVVLDAPTTLASFMVDGEPDRERFHHAVGALVRRLCAESTAGLTAYGEMVDLLAGQGNLIAAERLEALWNTLATECSFRLLCGYTASHFDSRLSFTTARQPVYCSWLDGRRHAAHTRTAL